MTFALRMNTKNVRRSGVQVLTHFVPTLGSTIESRMNWTTNSSAFMKPDGIIRSCLRYRRVVRVTPRKTTTATSQSMKTCLVTEKSMPKTGGRWRIGCSNPPFATCSMITAPASKPSSAACSSD